MGGAGFELEAVWVFVEEGDDVVEAIGEGFAAFAQGFEKCGEDAEIFRGVKGERPVAGVVGIHRDAVGAEMIAVVVDVEGEVFGSAGVFGGMVDSSE